MALVTPGASASFPGGQKRQQFQRNWGNYASAVTLPNASGNVLSATNFRLEAGDQAYVTGIADPFTCADPGTAGGGDANWAHTGTPAGFLSVLAYGARGNEDGTGAGTDDSAAFRACGIAAIAQGYGVWVPPSPRGRAFSYKISVEVEFTLSALNQQQFTLAGVHGLSSIFVNTVGDTMFAFENAFACHVEGIIFRGMAGRFGDCLRTLYFASCASSVVDFCAFKWIGATGEGVVYSNTSQLIVRDTEFGGCAASAGGTDAGACITGDLWARFEMERVTFNDLAYIENTTAGSKVGTGLNQIIPGAWARANNVNAIIGAFSQSTFIANKCWFDENAKSSIWVAPATNQLYAAYINDCECSSGITNIAGVPQIHISNVHRFEAHRVFIAQLGGGAGAQRDAIEIVGVDQAVLDAFRCSAVANSTNRITADATTGRLELIGMLQGVDYLTLSSSAALTTTAPASYPGVMVANGLVAAPDPVNLLSYVRTSFDERDIIVAAGATAIDIWGNQRNGNGGGAPLDFNNFTGTAATRPVTGRTINGHAALDFDGIAAFMASTSTTASMLFAGGYHVFITFLADTVTGASADYRDNDALYSDGTGFVGIGLRNNAGVYSVGGGHYDGAWKQTSALITLGAPTLVEMWYDGTTIRLRANDSATGTVAAGAISNTTGAIRLARNFGVVVLDGLIADFKTAAAPQSAMIQRAIRAYLSNKFNLGLLT